MYIRDINNTAKLSILAEPRSISGSIDRGSEQDIIKSKKIMNSMLFISGTTGCLSEDTKIIVDKGKTKALKNLPDQFLLGSVNFEKKIIEGDSAIKIDSGKKEVYELMLEDGRKVLATKDHKFFKIEEAWIVEKRLMDLVIGDEICVQNLGGKIDKANITTCKIKSIKKIGIRQTYDLKVLKNNNFVLSNGIITHNSGKTSATSSVANKLWQNGYTAIIITEKRGAEFSLGSCCLPEECLQNYHKDWLKRFRVKCQPRDVKIYHPFTFALMEKGQEYSSPIYKKSQFPIQYYTIPLKKLGDYSLNIILKGTEDKTAVSTCSKVLEKLGEEEDIRDFLKKVYDRTKDLNPNELKINVKESWGFFSEKETSVSVWKQILDAFNDFQKHFMLQSSKCPYNLDVPAMLNDQKSYHIISSKYIQNRRLKYLVIINILEQIVEAMNAGYVKKPLCLIFEEMKDFLPSSDQTQYEVELSRQTKRLLSTCRDAGKHGAFVIANSQDYFKTSDDFTSACSHRLIGRSSPYDKKRYMKDYSWKADEMGMLNRLQIGEFILWEKLGDEQKFLMHLPPHAISEEGIDFMTQYKKYFPSKLQTAEAEVDYFSKLKKESDEKMKEIAKEIKAEILKKREKEKEKKDGGKEKVAKANEKVKMVQDEEKQKLGKIAYEEYKKNPKISLRALAKLIGVSHTKVAKKYIRMFAEVMHDDEVVEKFQ